MMLEEKGVMRLKLHMEQMRVMVMGSTNKKRENENLFAHYPELLDVLIGVLCCTM